MKRTGALLLCLFLLGSTTVVVGQEPVEPSATQSEPFPLERYTLPNGLRVWHQPRLDSESVATLLVIGVGSRHETLSNSGISHFVEHMLFTGTERWTEEEIKDVIARRGGRWNGWTSTESTTYFAHVAAQDLDIALDWLSELVFHASLPEDKVDKEREVIFQERSGRYGWLINTLDSLGFGYDLHLGVRRALFPGANLDLAISGQDASLDSLDWSGLVDYYRQHYTTENALLIVVGNVTPEQLLDRSTHYFGDLEQGGQPSRPSAPAQPSEGPHRVVVRGPMLTNQVSLIVGARTVGRAHPDRWVLLVLAGLLDKALTEEIRYQRGLVYRLGAFNSYFDDAGYFGVSTTSAAGNQEAILETVERHLERVRRGEIDPEALADAKASLNGRWALSMEDNVERASWLAQWAFVLSEDETIPDRQASIDAVTPEDLSRVVASYFTPRLRYVGLHQPVATVASGARAVGGFILFLVAIWLARRLRQRARARSQAEER